MSERKETPTKLDAQVETPNTHNITVEESAVNEADDNTTPKTLDKVTGSQAPTSQRTEAMEDLSLHGIRNDPVHAQQPAGRTSKAPGVKPKPPTKPKPGVTSKTSSNNTLRSNPQSGRASPTSPRDQLRQIPCDNHRPIISQPTKPGFYYFNGAGFIQTVDIPHPVGDEQGGAYGGSDYIRIYGAADKPQEAGDDTTSDSDTSSDDGNAGPIRVSRSLSNVNTLNINISLNLADLLRPRRRSHRDKQRVHGQGKQPSGYESYNLENREERYTKKIHNSPWTEHTPRERSPTRTSARKTEHVLDSDSDQTKVKLLHSDAADTHPDIPSCDSTTVDQENNIDTLTLSSTSPPKSVAPERPPKSTRPLSAPTPPPKSVKVKTALTQLRHTDGQTADDGDDGEIYEYMATSEEELSQANDRRIVSEQRSEEPQDYYDELNFLDQNEDETTSTTTAASGVSDPTNHDDMSVYEADVDVKTHVTQLLGKGYSWFYTYSNAQQAMEKLSGKQDGSFAVVAENIDIKPFTPFTLYVNHQTSTIQIPINKKRISGKTKYILCDKTKGNIEALVESFLKRPIPGLGTKLYLPKS